MPIVQLPIEVAHVVNHRAEGWVADGCRSELSSFSKAEAGWLVIYGASLFMGYFTNDFSRYYVDMGGFSMRRKAILALYELRTFYGRVGVILLALLIAIVWKNGVWIDLSFWSFAYDVGYALANMYGVLAFIFMISHALPTIPKYLWHLRSNANRLRLAYHEVGVAGRDLKAQQGRYADSLRKLAELLRRVRERGRGAPPQMLQVLRVFTVTEARVSQLNDHPARRMQAAAPAVAPTAAPTGAAGAPPPIANRWSSTTAPSAYPELSALSAEVAELNDWVVSGAEPSRPLRFPRLSQSPAEGRSGAEAYALPTAGRERTISFADDADAAAAPLVAPPRPVTESSTEPAHATAAAPAAAPADATSQAAASAAAPSQNSLPGSPQSPPPAPPSASSAAPPPAPSPASPPPSPPHTPPANGAAEPTGHGGGAGEEVAPRTASNVRRVSALERADTTQWRKQGYDDIIPLRDLEQLHSQLRRASFKWRRANGERDGCCCDCVRRLLT